MFLNCAGDMTLREMTTAWREVQVALAELGGKRILADVTALQGGPETAELFDLAKLVWRDFPQTGRMALVVRWDQSALAKSLESVLRSVGIYLTVFVSKEMAEAWVAEGLNEDHRRASDSLPKNGARSALSKGSLLCHIL